MKTKSRDVKLTLREDQDKRRHRFRRWSQPFEKAVSPLIALPPQSKTPPAPSLCYQFRFVCPDGRIPIESMIMITRQSFRPGRPKPVSKCPDSSDKQELVIR